MIVMIVMIVTVIGEQGLKLGIWSMKGVNIMVSRWSELGISWLEVEVTSWWLILLFEEWWSQLANVYHPMIFTKLSNSPN